MEQLIYKMETARTKSGHKTDFYTQPWGMPMHRHEAALTAL